MRFSVSGEWNGRTETFSAETAAEAAAHAQRLRQLGAVPVHIKRDGRPLTDAHEFERLVQMETGISE